VSPISDIALFVTGFLIALIVVAGCIKLGREEEREALLRQRARLATVTPERQDC
jgi:hypothetical protein